MKKTNEWLDRVIRDVPLCRYEDLVYPTLRENRDLLGTCHELSENVSLKFTEVENEPVGFISSRDKKPFFLTHMRSLPYAILSLSELVEKIDVFGKRDRTNYFLGSRFREFVSMQYCEDSSCASPRNFHTTESFRTFSVFKPVRNDSGIVKNGETVFREERVSEMFKKMRVSSEVFFSALGIETFIFENGPETLLTRLPVSYCRSLTRSDLALRIESVYRAIEDSPFAAADATRIFGGLSKVEAVLGVFPSKFFPAVLAPFEQRKSRPTCHVEKENGRNILYIQKDKIERIGPIANDAERNKERDRFLGRVLLKRTWSGRPWVPLDIEKGR